MIELIEKYDETTFESESSLTRFYKLGKDHFEINIKGGFDYINNIKESIKILSFDLPAELKEIFIPYSEAPVYWIYDSWLLTQIEDYMKMHFVRAKYFDLHRSIKENYTKWVTTKLKNEKEHFANLTLNFIERDVYKHNFFKQILNGILLTYHNSMYNPTKALELFESAKGLIKNSRLSEPAKHELVYVINLYSAFVHFKESDYERANIILKEALEEKSNGITAKFYLALAELYLGHEDIATFYLKEVLLFDFHRLNVAMDLNNFNMFAYFFNNAFIFNVFYDKNFLVGIKIIENILHPYSTADENTLKKVQLNIALIKEKNIQDYLTEDITRIISFVENVARNFLASRNTLILGMYPDFERKYNEIIESVIERARNIRYNEIKTKLSKYDEYIGENVNAEKHLKVELENFKAKSKDLLAKTLNIINEDYDTEISKVENRIENLHNSEKYSPQRSFSTNMTYNLIVAFAVFLIAGIASYSNRVVTDVSEFNTILSYVLISGTKWGVISFCVGALISVVVAGLVIIERADEKQRLVKKIGLLKLNKEREIKEAKEYAEEKEKIMIENMNNSIQQHIRKAEELAAQKEEEYKKLKEEADLEIEKLSKELADVVTHKDQSAL